VAVDGGWALFGIRAAEKGWLTRLNIAIPAGESIRLFHEWQAAGSKYKERLDRVADLNRRRSVIQCQVEELADEVEPEDVAQQRVLLEFRSRKGYRRLGEIQTAIDDIYEVRKRCSNRSAALPFIVHCNRFEYRCVLLFVMTGSRMKQTLIQRERDLDVERRSLEYEMKKVQASAVALAKFARAREVAARRQAQQQR
jgi:hypothetical protein